MYFQTVMEFPILDINSTSWNAVKIVETNIQYTVAY